MKNQYGKKKTVLAGVLLAVFLLGGTGCADKTEDAAGTQAAAAADAAETVQAQPQTPSTQATEALYETNKAALRYWDVELPEDMFWQEFTEGEAYRVEFGMTLEGEKVMLYTVHVGDAAVQEVLGSLLVDGVDKMVGVNTYGLATQMIMVSEETTTTFSARMDTLKDVIRTLEQNEDFIREIAE